MRVAVVSPYAFDAPGGVQDQVARIVTWLRQEGHDAWAVAPGDGGPEGTRHVGRFRLIPANRSRAPVAVDPRVVGRVARAVADADVVHVHEPFMPMASLGTLMATTPPVVGTFHAHAEGPISRLYRASSPVLSRLARRIAVATAVSRVAAASAPDVPEVRIIPNGIDVDAYLPAGSGERRDVLFIGRDEPRKGLDILLQAWPLVRSRHPSAVLRIVGAERPHGPDGVVFLGRVAEDQKRAELASAAILVTPNLGGESFGIVGLEGLASGCAVVASDLRAFRAVCGDDAAVYAPPGDPVALAAAIRSVLGDDGLRSDLSAAALRRARLFDREVVLGAYLIAYEDAMQSA